MSLRRQRFGATSEALGQLEFGIEDEEIARAAEALPEPAPSRRVSFGICAKFNGIF